MKTGKTLENVLAKATPTLKAKIEQWRPVIGYDGLYEVSNFGRLRSLSRDITNRWGKITHIEERILSQATTVYGYKQVNLCKEGKIKSLKVHRLVAEAFIPNPNTLPCINHKDEVKTNNNVSNLEWCTWEYNTMYGTRVERCAQTQRENRGKSVDMYSLDGTFLKHYLCMNDTFQDGYNVSSVKSCCDGQSIATKGVTFRYSWDRFKVRSNLRGSTLIYRYIKGVFDKVYTGYSSAAKENHISERRIKRVLRENGRIAENDFVLSLSKN